jgi:hypothetical protein
MNLMSPKVLKKKFVYVLEVPIGLSKVPKQLKERGIKRSEGFYEGKKKMYIIRYTKAFARNREL